MNNRIKIYYPKKGVFNDIKFRSIAEDEPLPNGWFLSEAEALEAYNVKQKQIAEDYQKNKPQAMAILDKLEADIQALLEASNCELDFHYEGDSHGVYDESILISTTLNSHYYSKEVNFD